jgi:hypothetical protein
VPKRSRNTRLSIDGKKSSVPVAIKICRVRKDQREVEEQSRLQHKRGDVAPVNNPIEGIELAAVMETVQNE